MMEDRPPLTLGDALLQRRLLVLAIVATFVLGGAILSMQAPAYAASAMIYLDVSRTAPGFDEGAAAGELLQHDLIVLASSRAVLQAACAAQHAAAPVFGPLRPPAGPGRAAGPADEHGNHFAERAAAGEPRIPEPPPLPARCARRRRRRRRPRRASGTALRRPHPRRRGAGPSHEHPARPGRSPSRSPRPTSGHGATVLAGTRPSARSVSACTDGSRDGRFDQ